MLAGLGQDGAVLDLQFGDLNRIGHSLLPAGNIALHVLEVLQGFFKVLGSFLVVVHSTLVGMYFW
jgi:hypothetical protein